MNERTLELHPWNRDFTWTATTGPYRRLTDEQAAQFHRDGYVVLHDVFDASTLAPVIAEIDRFEAKTDAYLKGLENERISIAEAGAITFTTNLVTRSEVLAEFSRHPVFVDLCIDLIGPDVNLYWEQAVYKKPEKPRRFPWHQDNGYTFVEPQQYLTCWVALTEATAQNGCPHVAPGRHLDGTLLHTYVEPLGWECMQEPGEEVIAEVGPGSIVVFSSLTPHLPGPNTTDAVRKAYILQYAPAGAEIFEGDPQSTDEPTRVPTDDPIKRYAVARGGEPVSA